MQFFNEIWAGSFASLGFLLAVFLAGFVVAYAMLRSAVARLERENSSLRNGLYASMVFSELEKTREELLVLREQLIEAEKNRLRYQEEASELRELSGLSLHNRHAAAKEVATHLKHMLGNRIPQATVDEKDDLTAINGIGPYIEQKLNRLGIFTYEQIARFDGEVIEQVTEAIGFFPGRIGQDNWMQQANRLLQEKKKREQQISQLAAGGIL